MPTLFKYCTLLQHEGKSDISFLLPVLTTRAQILTEEELKEHNRVVLVGGSKGLFGGLAVSLPASYLAHRRWPYFRALPMSIKALGIISIAVPAFVIAAEQAGHDFERSKW